MGLEILAGLAVVARAAAVVGMAGQPPMNTFAPYELANTNTTPTFRGEYFEMYGSPQTSRYGDVDWHPDPVQLPQDIRERFDGKVMAITGFEVNIVRQTPSGDEHVLTTEQYNHHYTGWLTSKTMVEADPPFGRVVMGSHGNPVPHYVERLPESMTTCDIAGVWLNPQVNVKVNITATSTPGTYNASCIGSVGWKDATIVVSAASQGKPQGSAVLTVPSTGEHTDGLLSTFSATGSPTCSQLAWADGNTWALTPYAYNQKQGIPKMQVFSEGNGNEHRLSYKGFAKGYALLIESPDTFNNNAMIINTNKKLTDDKSPGPIGGPLPKNSIAPPNADYSGILECPCTTRKVKIISGYKLADTSRCSMPVTTLTECTQALKTLGLGSVTVTNVSVASVPPGCTANVAANGVWTGTFNTMAPTSAAQCASAPATAQLAGTNTIGPVSVSFDVNPTNASVDLTMACAANGSWFGVGLNQSVMSGAYAVVVDGTGAVSEHELGMHAAGTVLPSTVTVLSNTVSGGVRTVVVRFPVGAHAAPQAPQWTALSSGAFPVIAAVGDTPTLSYHKAKAAGEVVLGAVGTPSCVCRDPTANAGSIDGATFNPGVCAPYPTSELLNTTYGGAINPICNISAYDGGLYCCHGGTVLLDADQPQPEPTDTWRMKYRFYFEEYTNQSNTFRAWWSTEATNNEYTVPKSEYNCLDPATPWENCTHIMHSQFKAGDMLSSGSACMVHGDPNACADMDRIKNQDNGYFKLTYAAFHCHAPACMLGELWNRDTGELICRNIPIYGNSSEPMNEKGYVTGIPPCVWGSPEEGLPPPPVLHLDDNLTSVKHCNSTNGHWGVMALWQMRAAYVSA